MAKHIPSSNSPSPSSGSFKITSSNPQPTIAAAGNAGTLTLESGTGRKISVDQIVKNFTHLTPKQRRNMIESTAVNPIERRAIALELAILSGEDDRMSGYHLERAYVFDKFLENGRPTNEKE